MRTWWKMAAVLGAVGGIMTGSLRPVAAQEPGADAELQWDVAGEAEVVADSHGRSLRFRTGSATLLDASFRDGSVSFTLKAPGARSFVGLRFRTGPDGSYENVYLRPHKDRAPDALQYTPSFSGADTNWQIFHGPTGTAPARCIREKPRIIERLLDQAPFLWVDADSRLRESVGPGEWERWQREADVMATRSRANLRPRRRWYEGVVFINRTERAREFVAFWRRVVEESECSDGYALHRAEQALRDSVRLLDLEDRCAGRKGRRDAVIEIALSGQAGQFDQSRNTWSQS